MNFHITTKEKKQTKLGKMLRTTSSKDTCNRGCPFFNNGCYADNYPMGIHWDKVTRGERGTSWSRFLDGLSYFLEDNELWRHNEAGDLMTEDEDNERIDDDKLLQLLMATCTARGFTYTHLPMNSHNIEVLQEVEDWWSESFKINVSCETESAADDAINNGLRAVLTTDKNPDKDHWHTEGGNVCHVCPAQARGATCDQCKLCFTRGRKVIIVFRPHGASKKKVSEAVESSQAELAQP